VIVGIRPIRRKPVRTHANIVCEGMLASVNSVNSVNVNRAKVDVRMNTVTQRQITSQPIL